MKIAIIRFAAVILVSPVSSMSGSRAVGADSPVRDSSAAAYEPRIESLDPKGGQVFDAPQRGDGQ